MILLAKTGVSLILPNEELPDDELADLIKGKTLQVYWYMLRHPYPMTAREIQHGTELSSPSLSMHHLEKLRDIGLVDKSVHGEYTIQRDVRVGLLKMFSGRGRLLAPRFLFYATFFTSVTAALVTLLWMFIDWYSTTLIALLGGVCFILWYETVRIWREQPFVEGER